MEEMHIVFIDNTGRTSDGQYIYEFFLANDISLVFGEYWDVIPSGQCSRDQKYPHESTIQNKIEIRLPISLKLAQNNNSLSMSDVTDGILALAWEDISSYDEYPEYRLVIHYGESFDDVQSKIDKKLEKSE